VACRKLKLDREKSRNSQGISILKTAEHPEFVHSTDGANAVY